MYSKNIANFEGISIGHFIKYKPLIFEEWFLKRDIYDRTFLHLFKCSMMLFHCQDQSKLLVPLTHSTFLILTFLFCSFFLGELTLMQTSSSSTESRNNSGSTVRIKNSLFSVQLLFFVKLTFSLTYLTGIPKILQSGSQLLKLCYGTKANLSWW